MAAAHFECRDHGSWGNRETLDGTMLYYMNVLCSQEIFGGRSGCEDSARIHHRGVRIFGGGHWRSAGSTGDGRGLVVTGTTGRHWGVVTHAGAVAVLSAAFIWRVVTYDGAATPEPAQER